MTLDEAIMHAEDVGNKMLYECKTHECGKEHLQLAAWLKELKQLRSEMQRHTTDAN